MLEDVSGCSVSMKLVLIGCVDEQIKDDLIAAKKGDFISARTFNLPDSSNFLSV